MGLKFEMEKNHLEISDRADYLFKSKKKENAFIDIELSFFELNDYCFHLIQSTNKKYKDIDKIYSPEGQAKLEEEFLNDPNFSFEDINEDDENSNPTSQWFGPEDIVSIWKDNLYFITPATVLILLYFYTEKHLKELCKIYDKEFDGKKKFRLQSSFKESKIEGSFKYLRDKCNISFFPDDKIKNTLKHINTIRNNFAHGDWDEIKNNIEKISVKECFKISSSIFSKIEDQI